MFFTDQNGDHNVGVAELHRWMVDVHNDPSNSHVSSNDAPQRTPTLEDAKGFMRLLDIDSTGSINFNEFLQWMRSKHYGMYLKAKERASRMEHCS